MTAAELCRSNGWSVGDILQTKMVNYADEAIGICRIRLTAIGEQVVLVREVYRWLDPIGVCETQSNESEWRSTGWMGYHAKWEKVQGDTLAPCGDNVRDELVSELEEALETLERYGWWHEQQDRIRAVLAKAKEGQTK